MEDHEYEITRDGNKITVTEVNRTFETWGAIIGGIGLPVLAVSGLRDSLGDITLIIVGVVSFIVGSTLGWFAGMVTKWLLIIGVIVAIICYFAGIKF